MDKQTPTPKRFGQTAAASVDVNKPDRLPLSTYAGQELLLWSYRLERSEFGPYAVVLIKRHGENSEEVTTSGATVLEQLAAFSPDDWQGGIVAWLHQAKSVGGKTGRLWFSDEAPDDTSAFKNKLVADIGRMGKRGD